MCLCRIITENTDTPIDEKYELYNGYHELYVKASVYMSWLKKVLPMNRWRNYVNILLSEII